MRRASRTEEVLDAGESEMGPGVDLTVSLLAMVLIILVTLIKQHDAERTVMMQQAAPVIAGNASLAEELKRTQDKLAESERERTRVRVQAADLAAPLDQTRRDLAAVRADLERERRAGQLTTANQVSQANASAAVIAAAASKLDEAQRRADVAQARVAEQDRQIAALNERLAGAAALATKVAGLERDLAARVAGTLPVIRLDAGNLSVFDQDQAVLLSRAREKLQAEIPNLARAVRDQRANHLLVAGSSSPEPRVGSRNLIKSPDARDSNIDLSAARALAVAHYLVFRGVPYRCITVQGLGISRTKLPVGDEDRWAQLGPDRVRSLEAGFASERRVDVSVEQDANSGCRAETLLAALTRAAELPMPVRGTVGALSREGWPIINGKTYPLSGVEPIDPSWLPRFGKKFIGTDVECEAVTSATSMCFFNQTLDVAESAIMNHATRPLPGAPERYFDAAQGKRSTP